MLHHERLKIYFIFYLHGDTNTFMKETFLVFEDLVQIMIIFDNMLTTDEEGYFGDEKWG